MACLVSVMMVMMLDSGYLKNTAAPIKWAGIGIFFCIALGSLAIARRDQRK